MEQAENHKPLWTRKQYAGYCGVTEHTVDDWLRRKVLRGVKIGGAVRIYPPDQQPGLLKMGSEQEALQPA